MTSISTFISESEIFKINNSNYTDQNETIRVCQKHDWLPIVKRKLEFLLSMPENWNGYGELRINKNSAIAAYNVLMDLSCIYPEPDIVPTNNGDIQAEWHMNGVDLELEFIGFSTISLYFADLNSDEEVEIELSDDVTPAYSYLTRLL